MNRYIFYSVKNKKDKAIKLLKKVARVRTEQGFNRIQTDIMSFLGNTPKIN